MLTLITGQPGNGKTLYTIGLVEKLRTESGRPVYQSGIPELTLPWENLEDAELWHEKPNGSIIVIDECQRIFPPRKQGAPVPQKVSEFETHRHRGFDVYLITQHPQLLDIAVRKLVGRHYHVRRTFGRETAKVYQWERCVTPDDRSVKGEALVHAFPFPKERYQVYKSADIHTVKKELPWKPIVVLGASLVGVLALGIWSFNTLVRDDQVAAGTDAQLLDEAPRPGSEPGNPYSAEQLQPRNATWLWSAPIYDQVASVVSPPRVTGCSEVRIGNVQRCTCHNGQGVADVSTQFCRDFMEGRYFDPTKPVVDVKAENIRYLDKRDKGTSGAESESRDTGTATVEATR